MMQAVNVELNRAFGKAAFNKKEDIFHQQIRLKC